MQQARCSNIVIFVKKTRSQVSTTEASSLDWLPKNINLLIRNDCLSACVYVSSVIMLFTKVHYVQKSKPVEPCERAGSKGDIPNRMTERLIGASEGYIAMWKVPDVWVWVCLQSFLRCVVLALDPSKKRSNRKDGNGKVEEGWRWQNREKERQTARTSDT